MMSEHLVVRLTQESPDGNRARDRHFEVHFDSHSDALDHLTLRRILQEMRHAMMIREQNLTTDNTDNTDNTDDVRSYRLMEKLIQGIEEWGQCEDGLPDFIWDQYQEAKTLLRGFAALRETSGKRGVR